MDLKVNYFEVQSTRFWMFCMS